MANETNESERKVDALRQDFEKSEIRREKDKQIQEEQMDTLRSNLGEKLSDLVAGAERREKEMLKTVADIHKTIMFAAFGIIASVGVAAALLGVFLRFTGAG